MEFHSFLHGTTVYSRSLSAFPQRICAQSMPLREETLRTMILNQLAAEQSLSAEIALGRKHVNETIDSNIVDETLAEYNEALVHASSEIADEILEYLLREQIRECEKI